MHFIETLGWFRLLALAVTSQPVYYHQLSLSGRAAMWFAGQLHLPVEHLRKLEIGYLDSSAGVRAGAYTNAESQVGGTGCLAWADGLAGILRIDFRQIVEKYHFEFLYAKYLFIEMVLRYAAEHPDEHHYLTCEAAFAEPYLVALTHESSRISLRMRRSAALRFWGTLVLLPGLLFVHSRGIRWRGTEGNQLFCVVDDGSTRDMFKTLFGPDWEIQFLVEPPCVAAFPAPTWGKRDWRAANLSVRSWLGLLRILPPYVAGTFLAAGRLMHHGEMPFMVFHLLCKGRALAPEGKGNVLVTFEHLTLARAIRNEYLRAAGSVSIYVPKNSYVTYQQYPAEWKLNYDVYCSPGPHAEELYRRKRTLTNRFLPVGSYDAHRALSDAKGIRRQRVGELFAFRGQARLVTVLTPGICDETLSHERKLVAIAGKLSLVPGVRVVVRRKPVPLSGKYRGFYEAELAAHGKVLLTSGEFDLFDFIGPTDIFVTSISTSACDVALRGGTAAFIDFMGTPSIYLPLEKVPEMVLTPAEAYEKIKGWLMDQESGPIRSAHQQAMNRFVACVGYRFPSFDAYRSNLLAELRPWLMPFRRAS